MFTVDRLFGGDPHNAVMTAALVVGTVGYLTSRVVNRIPQSYISQLSPQTNALFQIAGTLAGLWCVKRAETWISSPSGAHNQRDNVRLAVRVLCGYFLAVAALRYGAQVPINHSALLAHTVASSLAFSFVYRPFVTSL